jgi:mannose-1-phosphate guanylyltransferase
MSNPLKVMILAAGKGERLRPLTESTPKILAPVLGLPMLHRLVAFLTGNGVVDIAINTHHLAGQVEANVAQLAQRHPAWPPLRLYHEPQLLDTGGGVANVADFWGEQPLLVWNGDVLADLAPAKLLEAHERSGVIATLAMQARESGSYLQVDTEGYLCGIDSPRRNDRRLLRRPIGELRKLAFNGISVLSPALRAHMPAGEPFDLIDCLLDAVITGAAVHAFDCGDSFWGTTGSPERLAALEAALGERPELLERWTPEG